MLSVWGQQSPRTPRVWATALSLNSASSPILQRTDLVLGDIFDVWDCVVWPWESGYWAWTWVEKINNAFAGACERVCELE